MVNDHDPPPASRIAKFLNGAEVFIATEEGAHLWMEASSHAEMPPEGPLLVVDARSDFDLRFEPADHRERIGIMAKFFTQKLRRPSDLFDAMAPVIEALVDGRRIIFFCQAGRHRSFQLAMWLMMCYFTDFNCLVAFVAMRRICVQATNLRGIH